MRKEFKVGDKVIWKYSNGHIFKGKVINILDVKRYPIIVLFNDDNHIKMVEMETFTADGRYYIMSPISLFHDITDKINKLLYI